MKDKILMPKELTAENGAKSLMMGEFFEEIVLDCTECDGSDLGDECDYCDGSGVYTHRVRVSWTTIKDIYKMAVKHLCEQP